MVPPPNSGDANDMNDDPLGGMDPMAWLESLAARQGANRDELVTAADLDIPVMPADTVVDEPGYTPGYETSKPKAAEPAQTQPVQAQPVQPPPPPASEPVTATAASDDPLGGMDPMAWLESLAARQGANPDELVTGGTLDLPPAPENAYVDEPGYADYNPFSASGIDRPVEPISAPQTPEPINSQAPASDDLLGGMDSLSWLESLASNDANADFDSLFNDLTSQTAEETQVSSMAIEEESFNMSPDEAAAVLGLNEPGGTSMTDEELAALDPLAWLESLAARQGANPEELVTGGTMELPPVPSNISQDVPFAATPTTSGMEPESALSFLEDLARDSDASEQAAVTPTPASAEGGMSNDINEVQAWLEQQAANLEKTRVELEDSELSGELPPAEPASDLPDWLRGAAPSPTSQPVVPALRDDIEVPVSPNELPDWLQAPQEQPMSDLEAELIKSIRETGTVPAVEEESIPLSTQEIEALTQPNSPDEVDSWAEALDEEYERKVAHDESVPDWYMEALARAEAERPQTGMLPPLPNQVEEQAALVSAPTESVMPDWLRENAPVEEAPALQGEIPDWLRSMASDVPAPEVPAVSTSTSDNWLEAGTAQVEEIPDWLRTDVTPAAQTEPEPVPPTPEPVAQAPVAPQPAPQPTQQPQRPQEPVRVAPATAQAAASGDSQGRLTQARQFVASNQLSASMELYQSLIDRSELLEETRGDLRQLVEKEPKEPRLRRLLGDTYMRLGDLQAALDTYRSALNQL